MPKREEVDWAQEIVQDMKKPLPRHAGDWRRVKVGCVKSAHGEMSVADSKKIVLGMMYQFFPEGPRSAMRAHAEFKAWVKEGHARGEQRYCVGGNTAIGPEEPVTEGVRQWDALWRNWENFSDWASGAVATPAEWDAVNGVDFSQVLMPRHGSRMRMRM
jgi:hypothetical protein